MVLIYKTTMLELLDFALFVYWECRLFFFFIKWIYYSLILLVYISVLQTQHKS